MLRRLYSLHTTSYVAYSLPASRTTGHNEPHCPYVLLTLMNGCWAGGPAALVMVGRLRAIRRLRLTMRSLILPALTLTVPLSRGCTAFAPSMFVGVAIGVECISLRVSACSEEWRVARSKRRSQYVGSAN